MIKRVPLGFDQCRRWTLILRPI